jgi:excinuclease ABC subunit A
MGPGAGVHGGASSRSGDADRIMIAEPRSLTGRYLSGSARIEVPGARQPDQARQLVVSAPGQQPAGRRR